MDLLISSHSASNRPHSLVSPRTRLNNHSAPYVLVVYSILEINPVFKVVGGPFGVEAELAAKVRLTLVDSGSPIMPMYSKQLIDYTVSTFKKTKIDIMSEMRLREVRPFRFA